MRRSPSTWANLRVMASGGVERRSGPIWGWMFVFFACPSACHQAAPGDEQAAQSAEQTFATVCARCHGLDGKGGVASLEGSNAPRNFVDGAFQASRTNEELKQVIRKGKGAMPPFGNLFGDAVLAALVHKVRTFNPDPKRH